MTTLLPTLKRAALWALLAAVLATALWALITATLPPLISGEGPRALARAWLPRAEAGIYFGGVLAVMAIVPHAVLFALWLAVARRHPALEQTTLQVAGASLALALPFTLVVFGSYAAPSYGLGPFWADAFEALPWVLLSSWGGIFLARLLVPTLRPKAHAVAA